MGGPTIPYKERVHVTLDSGGRIFLNQKAHKMMGRPLAVYLHFNRSKDLIILEKTDALSSSNSFLFRDGGYSSRIVWGKPFCKHFNIRVEGTVKFLNPTTDALGNLYLNLSETINVSAGKRPRKKEGIARVTPSGVPRPTKKNA
jgi:hypothetical protein